MPTGDEINAGVLCDDEENEARAWYGPNEAGKAIGISVVSTLLVNSAIFNSDVPAVRKKWSELVTQGKSGVRRWC